MPIEVNCPECSRHLRVPDKVAGKRVKCPKCGAAVRVPDLEAEPEAAEPAEAQPAAAAEPSLSNSGGNWWMKTEDGEQYGPIPKPELDQWFGEGRITADSQLLPEGAEQWMWASDVYPELDATSATESTPPAPIPASPAPVVVPPTGPVVGPSSASAGDEVSEAFSFAAADTSATARIRGGRKRVRKVVKTRPAAASPAATPMAAGELGEMSDKSKVVAGLLGIFLGAYGVHRFYLGYTGLGLCMLFTCGGCGIWSLIDAILVFAGSVPDAQGRPLQ